MQRAIIKWSLLTIIDIATAGYAKSTIDVLYVR